VEELMEGYLYSEVSLIPEVFNHLLGSGGKRLRPILLLISSDLCGHKGEKCHFLSAVIEFIHTASLLHDDIVDHAKTRRGKASANDIWGNSVCVLVGDFFYSKSYHLMTDYGNLSIMKLLSSAAAAMSEGEVFQLTKVGDTSLTEREYLSVIEKKTAILISATCAVGGILADAPETKIEALTGFGMRLGMAFQITDDTLDYIATEDEFGKAIGADLREGKITLPLIHTLKKCSPGDKNLIRKVINSKELDKEGITKVVSLIKKYKGIDYSLNKAREYIEEGKGFLETFKDSEPKDSLLTISNYIIDRRL
jgi:Geranylgeranyl pyrophosphate synthase